MSFLFLLSFFVFVYYIYSILKEKYTYWTKKNIVQCEPWFLFGNYAPLFFQKMSNVDLINSLYKQFPSARYIGIYQFVSPNLLIRDIDLIKRITVKDFETFPEHRSVIPEESDPLFAKNILFMRGGEKWQRLRSLLSPTFTSSKLKSMYPFMVKCAKQFVDHYENIEGVVELEIKETFSKCTNDVIATTAFGMECDSFDNPDNMFYTMGKQAVPLSFVQILKTFMFLSPFIMKLFQLRMLPMKVNNFFQNVVISTLKFREENGIVRPDMLHLLNEARKGRMQYDEEDIKSDSSFAIVQESEAGKKQKFKYSDITDDDLIAQAITVFLSGFDTVSTALSFCSYELAINPDIQEKLRNEIDQFLLLSSNENFITYEELLSMKYLDLVVTESLRKWPSVVVSDRHSVKPFTIKAEHPEEETVYIPKGTVCLIPVHAIQNDPKYFPNPEKFDPERFADENKHLITPGSYFPFGSGPKNCIGSRFGLLEMKIILFALLSKFEIVPVSKTHIPMITRKKGIFLGAEGGFWLGLKKRIL